MSRPQTLLLFVGLIALMAIGGFFLLDSGGDPLMLVDPAPGTTETENQADLAADDAKTDQTENGAREAVTEAAAPDAAAGLDPELAAELAGFRGRVLHHDGKPAERTRVVLYRGDMDGLLGDVSDWMSADTIVPDIDGGEATTDDAGRFTIRGVWPRGVYLLHAGVDSDNPTPVVVERTPGNREMVDLGDIYLRNGATVSGIVLDSEGQPRAGALVRVTDLPMQVLQMVPIERFDPEGALIIQERRTSMVLGMPAWVKQRFDDLPIPTARTDNEGAFRVTGIPPGENVVVVTARDHPSLMKPGLRLQPGQDKDVGTLSLRMGEEVYGVVSDSRGQPVPNAEVLVAQGGAVSEVSFASRAIRTDEKGAFSAVGFRNGKVLGAARRGPGSPWVIGKPQPVLRDLEIVLPSALQLTIKLVSSAGRPIEEPVFRLLPGRSGDGALELARFGLSQEVVLEGRAARTEDGRYRFGDLAPGRYTLLVRCSGHAVSSAAVNLTADGEQTINLSPDASVAVLVQDREGRPVRATKVYFEAKGRGRVGDMPLPIGRTGADGRVFTGQVTPGQIVIMAHHPKYGWAHHRTEVPGPEIVIMFDKPGVLEGVLTDSGRVPDLGKWTVVAERRLENGRGAPELPRMTAADADGNFAIKGLQPGLYKLEVLDSFSRFTSPGTFVQQMMMQRFANSNSEQVTVHAGQTTHVSIDAQRQPGAVEGPSARISGTVLINGMPGQGMMLTGWGQSRVSAAVDAAGRFDLGQIKEGHMYLQLVDPSGTDLVNRGSMWSKSLKIVANEDQTLDIALQTAALSGFVTDASGEPVGGAHVRMDGIIKSDDEKNRASANYRAITDERGYYSIDKLPGGQYTVRAEHDQNGIGVAPPIELVSGSRQVDVRLRSTVNISGHIDMTVFEKKPSYVWLTFNPKGPNPAGQSNWVQVQADGAFEVQRVVPGDYSAQAWVNFENEQNQEYTLESTLRVGDQDMSDVAIRLVKKVRKPAGK